MEYLIIIVSIIAVLIIIFIIGGVSNSCPSCNEWYAKEDNGRKLIDKRTGVRTVTRTKTVRSSNGESFTEYFPAQERFAELTYRNNYKCEKCNYKWYDTETETTSSFYDD